MSKFLVIGRSRRDTVILGAESSQKAAERLAMQACAQDTVSEAHVISTLASFSSSSVNRTLTETSEPVNETPPEVSPVTGEKLDTKESKVREPVSPSEIDAAVNASAQGDDAELKKLLEGKPKTEPKPEAKPSAKA